MDPGHWILLTSWALIAATLYGGITLLGPRHSGTGLALYSTACAIVSVPAAYATSYLGEHHDDIEWMSGNVIGAVELLMMATFFCGLMAAAVSTSRAARRHQMNVVVFLPWIAYLAIGVFAATHPS